MTDRQGTSFVLELLPGNYRRSDLVEALPYRMTLDKPSKRFTRPNTKKFRVKSVPRSLHCQIILNKH